jgi:ABC-type bacteriocin/lantibiotic exporter with double-glycine peptidase domain
MVLQAQRCRVHEDVSARAVRYLTLVLLLTLLVTGCAEKKFAEIRPGLETRGKYIEGVPFYQKSESTSGPAALASILEFRGRPESVERITEKIAVPEIKVTRPGDMEKFAREAGFKTDSYRGSFGELKAYIRKRTPVICMLDVGVGLDHQPHYISVVGYDDINEVVIVHDGLEPNSVIKYKEFNKKWVRADYWMLVIEPVSEKTR